MTLEEKLKTLPNSPGVYIHKNEAGKIIYIGKAKNLKNRVRSYFQSNRGHDRKTRELVRRITDFEYIVVDNEVEALVLESNLIKKHKPRFNVLLKDDKQYPHLKMTNEEFPKVVITQKNRARRRELLRTFSARESGAKNFGFNQSRLSNADVRHRN